MTLFPPPQPLPPQRRAEIRALLSASAASGAEPTRRLQVRPRLAIALGGLAAAIIAVLVSWLVPSSSPPQPRLAAWTAVPSAVSAAQTSKLADDCAARVSGHFPISLGQVTFALAEERGASHAVLLVGPGGTEAVCVDGDQAGGQGNPGAVSGPVVGIVTVDPVRGSLVIDGTAGGPATGLTAVFGRVTKLAAAVSVTTQAAPITATVGGGYFLAWWPAGQTPVRVIARDSSGHIIADMPAPEGGAGSPRPQRSK